MAYKARIIFTGVCAYIPNAKFSTGGRPSSLMVVMADGRNGKVCNAFDLDICEHMPYMALPEKVDVDRRPEIAYRIRKLVGRRLKLGLSARDAAANPFTIAKPTPRDALGPSPTANNGADLGWLPGMNTQLPNHAAPIKRCTEFPIGSPLIAQAEIGFGTVKTHYSEDMEWTERYWSFRSPGSPSQEVSAFANQVEISLELQDELKLHLLTEQGALLESPRLGPVQTATTLDLVVGNLCDYLEENPAEIIAGQTLAEAAWFRLLEQESQVQEVKVPPATSMSTGEADDDLRLLYCLFEKRDELVAAYPPNSKHVPTLIFEHMKDGRPIKATRTAKCYGGLLEP